MGAWGFKPFDNDGAQDWINSSVDKHLHSIVKNIAKVAKRKFIDSYQYEEVRAAAETLLDLYKAFGSNSSFTEDADGVPDQLISSLQFILNDKDWIDSWEKPSTIRVDLRRQISKLTELDSYHGIESSYPKFNRVIKVYHDEL